MVPNYRGMTLHNRFSNGTTGCLHGIWSLKAKANQLKLQEIKTKTGLLGWDTVCLPQFRRVLYYFIGY